DVSKPKLYDTLLGLALQGDADCGGLLSYGYISGEHITGFEEGRPLFVRKPASAFTLANFMRVHLFSSLGALKTGLKILFEQESVQVDEIRGHGGFFKTQETGQKVMAAATNVPISVMETAGEGGAWGIALLAAYMVRQDEKETLSNFLADKVFSGKTGQVMAPDPADVAGFDAFFQRYTAGLPVEKAAVELLK
ncbi:MAG: FGGY-family carbohydrate kinase, partial [Bacillota bacterium]|nr:FGGY-family carbohydrate kinase [Bacillota bacterium]